MAVSFDSPYYPYEKDFPGFNTLNGADLIPGKIIRYLLDLPDANGYVPVDDNQRPRVRLMKYLWYDEPNPLAKPLPTPEQKLSLLYNGENAELTTDEDEYKHPKGYRLFGQSYWMAARLKANVLLKCYMGRVIPRSDLKSVLGVHFQLDINYALESLMHTEQFSKTYAMFQACIEALHGVNIAGVGVLHFDKSVHGDCGYSVYHQEGGSTYADWVMAIEWQESTTPDMLIKDYSVT